MRNLIAYFIKYPVLGNVILIVTLIFGYFGLNSLKSTLFPEAESRIILVQIVYPGASPSEIEEGVVLKIEDNLKGVTGVERISSVSNENSGTVTVEVLKEYKTEDVLLDVKNAVDRISSFPAGMEPPVVFINERLNFALSFALSGKLELEDLKRIAQKAERDIRAREGISKVELSGFPDEEIEIGLRKDDLRAYNLSFSEVATAVRKANLDITGGSIKGEREELLIRGRNKEYRADDLKNIVIKSNPNGTQVKLYQVADVRDRWSDNPNRTWFNDERSVVITVQNTIDEDILAINDYLYEYIAEFNRTHDEVSATIIRDGSTSLRQRIALLTKNGLIGAVLVVIFLALFLDRRLAFWVALSIPVSFAGMFILAAFYGLTINVISLFGMILVIGILVDDGIVISENIYQKFEEGMKPIPAAIEGTLEVLPAVISAILTTVVAFGAFFFLDGRLGEFAPNMAFVVIGTLGFSLIEGALILPAHVAHSSALTGKREKKGINVQANKLMFYLRDKLYAPFLRFCLQNKLFFTLAMSLGFLIFTIASIGGGIIQTTFFPFIERNNVDITLKMPAGTREDITVDWLNHLEKAVWEVNDSIREESGDSIDYIIGVQKNLGPGTYQGALNIILVDAESREGYASFEISNRIREQAGTIYGAEELSFGIATPFGKAVSVALKSYDRERLDVVKAELLDSLNRMSVLKDITQSDLPGLREVNLSLKAEANALGLQLQDVLSQVRAGFFGAEVQRLQRGEDEVKVWVRLKEEERSSIGELLDMRIQIPGGLSVPLRELAEIEVKRGVVGINHLDGIPEVRVEAEVGDPTSSVSDINTEIRDRVLPPILAKYPDVQYSFEGQSRQNKKVQDSMKFVMPIVLIIMFTIIVFTFRSFGQAIAVYLMIPFAIIGIGWGHWIHGMPISMLSAFGIIALIGVLVNDSLVFVTMVNHNVKDGMDYDEAIYQAGLSRFRPIVLTSVTTIAGLGPLILEKSFQAQFLVPMAISVAYGLLIATYTTLILLPSLLMIFNRINVYALWLWRGKKPAHLEASSAYKELKSDEQFEAGGSRRQLSETNES